MPDVQTSALFAPIFIGGVEIRNRVVMPPMTTRYSTNAGFATSATVAYYQARARGGVGLITVEMAAPEVAGRHRYHELGIYDDKFLPGLETIVKAIHDEGARASIQLGHGGSRARRAVSQVQPIAPSAIPTPVFEIEQELAHPEAMTKERIEETIGAFVSAAARAKRAGFDMVELHGAHGYLISQFLSPSENVRTDEFGGSLRNRARFGLRIIEGIKAAVPGLPVIYRLGAEDFYAEGLHAEDAYAVAEWAVESGADAISVTAGHYRSQPGAEVMIPPMAYKEGIFLDLAAAVKARVKVPVIGVGRLGDPEVAGRAITEGKLDMTAIGRPLLADAEWVNKTMAGKSVRSCLSCNHCVNNMRGGNNLSCVVNPTTGRELEFAAGGPATGKKIVVIGAGPAGLSYASLTAPGNTVSVIDKRDQVGGNFLLTGKAPIFNDVKAAEPSFAAYISNLENECRRAGVRFHLGKAAQARLELLQEADLVVIAAGARYRAGLGPLVEKILNTAFMKSGAVKKVFSNQKVRDFFYYRLRVGRGNSLVRALGLEGLPSDRLVIIGDAAKAGKAREAITSAFDAALRPVPAANIDSLQFERNIGVQK
ncbi:oxidoreductase [Arthrobacter sp. B2a2-09]|uniref:oxidoreductase n=1 Tax=Arthrobacter sp. B2a2-09 TaxID=2952822 RepID=UPI0022CD9B88|nr:NAD(P)-binding protein [Arthrobacter sp. B2a2-09]MCZ9884705.1 NAD(P)/FAD-dependent oxidoreductase [Arthrobacter sp. B2a2-09]